MEFGRVGNDLPSQRRLDLQYIIMQAGFWAMFAAFCGYQTALLLERGFTNGESGLIIAVRCLAGIVCQPILGGFADRHPNVPLKLIVALSLAAGLVANCVFYLYPMGMAGTLMIFIVLGGLELTSYPLMDSMAIQFINAGVNIRYSLGRGVGSMAYAITCVFLGMQVTSWGVESVLITHGALILLEIILVMIYPTFKPEYEPVREAAEMEKPHTVLQILRGQPRFTLMLVAVFFGITACLPMSNFLINIVLDRGGTSGDLGIALFLMGAAELPTAFVFGRLMRRFGSGKLMVMSVAFMLLKLVAFLFAPNLGVIYVLQLLQMMGYGLFTPTSVYYVNENVPSADRVRGQTLMMVASNGLGGMAGSLIGGQVLDLGGVNAMLLFCIICGVAAVAFAVWAVRAPARNS